jgi:hypothetical protein
MLIAGGDACSADAPACIHQRQVVVLWHLYYVLHLSSSSSMCKQTVSSDDGAARLPLLVLLS